MQMQTIRIKVITQSGRRELYRNSRATPVLRCYSAGATAPKVSSLVSGLRIASRKSGGTVSNVKNADIDKPPTTTAPKPR